METTVLKKKGLGQFYTPITVVDFILDTIKAIGGSRLGNSPRLIDPACGEGVFLVRALHKEIGVPSTIVGVDIDKQIKAAWENSGLSGVLNGNLFVQNGLYDTSDATVSEKRKGGLFDVVVGNPPYGGIGLSNIEKDRKLFNALKTYELWKLGTRRKGQDDQGNLFRKDVLDNLKRLIKAEIEQLERFPIEILFLERFIKLAKPAGVIGIIIPDGILANVNYGYVRDWISERCHVVAIVSLPRNVFRGTGTTAKTSILFFQKKGPSAKPRKNVFMAQIDEDDIKSDGGKTAFDFVRGKFKTNFQGRTSNSPRIWTDITHGDLGGGVRWDADYYDPKYREPIKKLKKKWELKKLGDFIEHITYGSTAKMVYKDSGIFSISASNITDIGIDHVSYPKYVGEGSKCFVPRSELLLGDILIIRSGRGSIGRVAIFNKEKIKSCASQDVDLVRLKGINTFYVTLFLKTKLGKLQIERAEAGVSGVTHLRFVDIENFEIPIIKDAYVSKCEKDLNNILKKYETFLSDKNDVINGLINEGYIRQEAVRKSDLDFEQRYLRLKRELEEHVMGLEEYLIN